MTVHELATRIESFVREVVIPFETDPCYPVHGHGPDESLVTELRALARAAGLLTPHIRDEGQRSIINRLLNDFEGKLNSSKWAKITKVSTDTALRDIQDLVEKRILVRDDAGGRSTSYSLTLVDEVVAPF